MHDKSIEMDSKYNEGKYGLPERFSRTLDAKIYKHMTAVSKNEYINVLDEMLANTAKHIIEHSNWKNWYKVDTYVDHNGKVLKFKVDDHVRVSK